MRSGDHFAARTVFAFSAVAAVFLAGLGFGTAHSQAPGGEPADKATELRGEWRRAGAGFACKVAVAGKLAPEQIKPEILSRACLHMGPFVVGDDASALTALGAPHRTLPQPKGATALVYFLEKAGQYPYLVATVSKQKIVALQVSGPAAAKGYSFNHVELGAGTDALQQYFGPPGHLGPSGEKDTDLWTYNPWPFSFEVRDGHVTSIRITDPSQ
jgi:hypothetical protein